MFVKKLKKLLFIIPFSLLLLTTSLLLAFAQLPKINPIFGIDGNGTANFIAKFIDENTIGNSGIFESGGKVGIGATNPLSKLDISAPSSSVLFPTSTGLVLLNNETTNFNSFGIDFMSKDTAGNLEPFASIAAIFSRHDQGSEQGAVVFSTRQSGAMGVGMFIDETQDVGIGMPYLPDGAVTRLHVGGGTGAHLDGGGYVTIGDVQGRNLVLDDIGIMTRNNGGNSNLLFQRDGGSVQVHEFNPVVITDSGKVGIGTTIPNQHLHVIGNASITKRLGIGTNSPDEQLHIFGEGAKLRLGAGSSTDQFASTLEFSEQTDANGNTNFGFSFHYDDVGNKLEIRRHNSDTAGAPVITIDRITGEVGISRSVSIGTELPNSLLDVAGQGRFSGGIIFYGCGTYVAASICPIGATDGPNCDKVPAGSFCEGDGECFTSDVNNCGGFDWFYKWSAS